MPSHVLCNGLGLTYKGTIGLSIATIPDVCKTPSPGGPIPIPYPNIANQGSLDKGTKKVKAKGKMVAVKGSQYTRSNGDEAGTAGGVKSSVNMKATDWILYSFDVKMEGKNACRHTDKKFHNNQNTVDLAGNIDPAAPAPTLAEIADECNKQINDDEGHCPGGPSGRDCTTLGTKKHKCCEDEINRQKAADPGLDGLQSEVAYKKIKKKPPKYRKRSLSPGAKSPQEKASKVYEDFISKKVASYKTGTPGQKRGRAQSLARKHDIYMEALRKEKGGDFIADVVKFDPPPKEAWDFKFNCKDEGHMSADQKKKYKDALGLEPKIIHKDGRECP